MAETTAALSTTKVTSIRADEDTMEKFRSMASEYGNQGQALAALVSMHESQQLRTTMPDRQAEFDTIEAHLSAIREMFSGSMQLASSTAERIKAETRAEMTAQRNALSDLRGQLAEAQQKNKALEMRVDVAEAHSSVTDAREEMVKALREQLEAREGTIKSLREQLEATRQMHTVPQ